MDRIFSFINYLGVLIMCIWGFLPNSLFAESPQENTKLIKAFDNYNGEVSVLPEYFMKIFSREEKIAYVKGALDAERTLFEKIKSSEFDSFIGCLNKMDKKIISLALNLKSKDRHIKLAKTIILNFL